MRVSYFPFTYIDELEELELTDTKVTDAGLTHLKELNNLEMLDLIGTQVTDEGVKQLQQALPNCRILSSPLKP